MKLIILKDKLKKGISIIEKISTKSISLPILNNVLFSTEKNFLNLTTTDLEISIKWWALAKIKEQGKMIIPLKILSSFVNFLPNKLITLSSKGFDLEIECDNRRTIIKGVNPEDFPIIPKVFNEEKINIPAKLFCKGLISVVDIASSSSIKPEISGIYLSFQKNLITMTATDSFRLGEKKTYLDLSTTLKKDYSLILPQKTVREIINIFSEKEESITIYFSPNQILFETLLSETNHSDIHLTSRLIEGDYPNYQEIVPKKHETRAILSLEEFINQVKLASLFSGRINEVKLKIDAEKERIVFFSQSTEVGEYQSFLKGKIEGKSCEISFNYRFLLDGLLNINLQQPKSDSLKEGKRFTGQTVLELSGSEKPAVLRLRGEDNYFYLVMPIKS